MNTNEQNSPDLISLLTRMFIMGACTLILGTITNQFLGHGYRLPVLIKSIPIFSLGKIKRISQQDALTLLNEKKANFVDTRAELEFDMDHVPGAVSVSYYDFFSNPKLIDAYNGDLALTAIVYGLKDEIINEPLIARFLKSKGVKEVRILEGGFELWTKNNYPVDF